MSYYNRFDPSKKWKNLRALAGRRLQSAELNEIQALSEYRDQRLGDALFGAGHIVDGCQPHVSADKKSVRLTSGSVYAGGAIHDVAEVTLAITGSGLESIGLKLNESIVTHEDDNTLLDPALGSVNFGLPGMDRLVITPEWKVNDPTSIVIYQLNDGQILTKTAPPELDGINPILARRTFDESGNYKVNGFKMWAKDHNATQVQLTVENGKAYIKGFERELVAPVKLLVGKALSTRTVLNEPKTFRAGTNLYKLNNKPVKQINKVVGVVRVTQTITRGTTGGGRDLLPKAPVVRIVSITGYTQGVDYQLTNDSVDWGLAGAEPAIGASYSVTWEYNKQMVSGVDYQKTIQNGEDYLDFSLGGDDPVADTTVQVDYDFYLARKDLVCMDKEGQILVVAGQPDTEQLVEMPRVSFQEYLPLGTITLGPNSGAVVVNPFSITRYSMEDIQKLVKRIDDLEYNQAVEGLDNEAQIGESPTNLKGIFTDGFISVAKGDTTYNKSGVAFRAGYDLDRQEISVPAANTVHDLVMAGTSTTTKWENVVTSKLLVSEPVVQQLKATESMLVNPYAVFNRVALVGVHPPVDNWVDSSTIVVEEVEVTTATLRRWWWHQGASWAEEERRRWQELGAGDFINTWDEFRGASTVVSDRILEEAILFMRPKQLKVTGQGFEPNADNLMGYFDGQPITLNPEEGTIAGTAIGSIRANGEGKFTCTFMIPSGTRTGTRLITIANENNEGSATYTAEGRKQITERTVLRREVNIRPVDPLAQSFSVPTSCFISGVGLYFTAKDLSTPLIVQIRNMVNGFPGREVLTQRVLEPSQITAQAKAQTETFVSFPNPAYCLAEEQYCIVVLSSSNVYALGVAELGKQDMQTQEYVSRQPYVVGVLFSSSNALTWTDHQTKDMKFKLYACNFQEQSTLEFGEWVAPGGVKFDRIVLGVDDVSVLDTYTDWEVQLNGSGNWLPIIPYGEVELPFLVDRIKVRAILHANKYRTPVIDMASPIMVGFTNDLSANYVSRLVTTTQTFDTVKQIVDLAIPEGSNIVVQFSVDDGATWITPSSVTSEQLDQTWTRYTYTHTLGAPANIFRARLSLTTNQQYIRPRARRLMNIIK